MINLKISIILLIFFLLLFTYTNKFYNIFLFYHFNKGYHPKVIYFDNLWNGYKYWMAYTPYPKCDAKKENPFIMASNDLIHWRNTKSLKNPLDIPKISDKKHYNSDTHLLFNNITNSLEVFWRYVNDKDNEVIIYVKNSKNGINWSNKKIFIKSKNRKKQDYISPSIIFSNGVYRIWYVYNSKLFCFTKKKNKFSNPRMLDIIFTNRYKIWHIDIIYNEEKKLYELIASAFINWKKRKNMPLFYLSSKDNIIWTKPIKILDPKEKPFKLFIRGFYRSSLTYYKKKYYLFYSFHNTKKDCGIGFLSGNNITSIKFNRRKNIFLYKFINSNI